MYWIFDLLVAVKLRVPFTLNNTKVRKKVGVVWRTVTVVINASTQMGAQRNWSLRRTTGGIVECAV